MVNVVVSWPVASPVNNNKQIIVFLFFFYYFLVNGTYVSIVSIKAFYVFPIEQLLEVYKSNFYTWVNQFNLTNALSLTKLYHRLLSLSLSPQTVWWRHGRRWVWSWGTLLSRVWLLRAASSLRADEREGKVILYRPQSHNISSSLTSLKLFIEFTFHVAQCTILFQTLNKCVETELVYWYFCVLTILLLTYVRFIYFFAFLKILHKPEYHLWTV